MICFISTFLSVKKDIFIKHFYGIKSRIIMLMDDQILASIARSGFALRLNANEWKVLSAASKSLTIAKISETTKLPYSTVIDVVKRLARRGIIFSFVPHCDAIDLKPIFVLYGDRPLRNVPVYTQSVYDLRGKRNYKGVKALVPAKYIHDYLSLFPGELEYYLIGSEIRHWTPEGKLTNYHPKYGLLLPREDTLYEVIAESRVPLPAQERRWVDWVDLLIIYFKMRYSFTKLSDMAGIITQTFNIEPPSRQLMSYHYRTHVTSLWSYNRPSFRLNTALIPLKLFIFQGSEGETAAKTLIQAPYMYEAIVEFTKGLVIGQPPSFMESLVYQVINTTNPDIPFGFLLVTEEKSTPWISSKVIEYYKSKGEFPEPEVDSFEL